VVHLLLESLAQFELVPENLSELLLARFNWKEAAVKRDQAVP
jgi:hypothetical protein